jgi:hypothetical protein
LGQNLKMRKINFRIFSNLPAAEFQHALSFGNSDESARLDFARYRGAAELCRGDFFAQERFVFSARRIFPSSNFVHRYAVFWLLLKIDSHYK